MTTGIYLLEFEDGSQYVGQAVDIERRWTEHTSNLYSNKAANKMQQCFKHNGLPKFSILVICHKDHLNLLEAYFIQQINPILNTVRPTALVEWELDMISTNMHMFSTSVLGIVYDLAEEQNNNAELKDKVDEALELVNAWADKYNLLILRQRDEICEDLQLEFEMYKEDSLKYEEELKSTIEAQQLEIASLSRPWWKKLFN